MNQLVPKGGIVIGASAAAIVMSLLFNWMVDSMVELTMAGVILYLVTKKGS
jgi:hypothetical protein